MSFSRKLRSLRIKNNMTQDYVANKMNVSRSTIAGYETKGRQPSHEKLTALANIFHVTIDYLLEDGTITLTPTQSDRTLTPEQLLIKKFNTLSPDSQGDLFEYVHLLELRDKERP